LRYNTDMGEYELFGLALCLLPLVAFAGCAMMLAAFRLVHLRGDWEAAMRPDATGKWPLARKLMVCGATLGLLFSIAAWYVMRWAERLAD